VGFTRPSKLKNPAGLKQGQQKMTKFMSYRYSYFFNFSFFFFLTDRPDRHTPSFQEKVIPNLGMTQTQTAKIAAINPKIFSTSCQPDITKPF